MAVLWTCHGRAVDVAAEEGGLLSVRVSVRTRSASLSLGDLSAGCRRELLEHASRLSLDGLPLA